MQYSSVTMLALLVAAAFAPGQSAALMKAFSARSLAAAGVPDPLCKTGVISLKQTGKPQSCCAGYCGECTDYKTCESVRGQNSKNACCATAVYEMRCGNAPANVCLKKCSEAVPPCIMDEAEKFVFPETERVAGDDCNEAVEKWNVAAEAGTTLPKLLQKRKC